jgi:hypothetical protein
MSTLAIAVDHSEVNRQFLHGERRIVARARRLARKHGMMLRKSRRKFRNAGHYRLTATVIISGNDFELTAEDVIRLCELAEKREVTQSGLEERKTAQ